LAIYVNIKDTIVIVNTLDSYVIGRHIMLVGRSQST